MWNKQAAPPQARPAIPPDGNSPDAAPDGAAGQAQGGGQPQPGQMPAEFAQHVDPNNPIQTELVKRVGSLTQQESQAFFQGITVEALQVLKKILPELAFVFDRVIQHKQAAEGVGADTGAPDEGAAEVPPAQPSQPPTSVLRQVQA